MLPLPKRKFSFYRAKRETKFKTNFERGQRGTDTKNVEYSYERLQSGKLRVANWK